MKRLRFLEKKEEMRDRRKKRKNFQKKNKKPWMKSSIRDIKIQSRFRNQRVQKLMLKMSMI